MKKNNFELDSGEKGVTKWIDEIVWREFYKNIMFSFQGLAKACRFKIIPIKLNGALMRRSLKHGRMVIQDFL